jgi:hypothetical protein
VLPFSGGRQLHGISKEKRKKDAWPHFQSRLQSPNSTIRQGKQEVNCTCMTGSVTTRILQERQSLYYDYTTDVTQFTGSHVQFGRYFLPAPITNCHTTTTALFPRPEMPS